MTLDVWLNDASEAMRQAHQTADEYMMRGIVCIDERLGDGFAARHPDLLAAFMQTAAHDFHGCIIKAGLQDLCEALHALTNKS